jgi:hypothetical protein
MQRGVTAGMAAGFARDMDRLAFSEVPGEVEFGFLGSVPGLAFVVAHLEPALFAVERHAVPVDEVEMVRGLQD